MGFLARGILRPAGPGAPHGRGLGCAPWRPPGLGFSLLEACLAGLGAEEGGQGAFWPYGAQSLSGCLDRPDKDIKG